MRHGAAEPYAQTDLARALTARGRADASAAGRYLADEGLVPDHAFVSAAERTRQTWDEVRAASKSSAEADFDQSLYGAHADGILEMVRLAPEDAGTVLVIGHNPAAAYLASTLDGGDGDADALRRLIGGGFPPAALAAFELEAPWSALDEGAARLTHVHVGRG